MGRRKKVTFKIEFADPARDLLGYRAIWQDLETKTGRIYKTPTKAYKILNEMERKGLTVRGAKSVHRETYERFLRGESMTPDSLFRVQRTKTPLYLLDYSEIVFV